MYGQKGEPDGGLSEAQAPQQDFLWLKLTIMLI